MSRKGDAVRSAVRHSGSRQLLAMRAGVQRDGPLDTLAEAGPKLLRFGRRVHGTHACTTLAPSGADDAGKRAAALPSQVCHTPKTCQKAQWGESCFRFRLVQNADARLCDPSFETSFRFTCKWNAAHKGPQWSYAVADSSESKTPSQVIFFCFLFCHSVLSVDLPLRELLLHFFSLFDSPAPPISQHRIS